MFCQNCGSELNNTDKFCPNCGAPVEVREAVVEEPVTEIVPEPAAPEEPVSDNGFSKALTLMIFSIVGVAFGTNPYTSLLGIIFSAIARGMVRRFREAGYQIGPAGLAKKAKVSGIFAKVGSIVSIVGLILSIVMFVILIIIIAVLAITAAVKSGR